MGLFQRLTAGDETKIPIHAFGAAMLEWARGAATKAQLVSAFSLSGDDITNLDAIKTQHDGLPTDAAKEDYRTKVHDVFILIEAGLYNEAKAKSELGF